MAAKIYSSATGQFKPVVDTMRISEPLALLCVDGAVNTADNHRTATNVLRVSGHSCL
jgi:hypothetical protein